MDGFKILLVTLGHFLFALLMFLLNFFDGPVHIVALFGKDGVELIQACSRV